MTGKPEDIPAGGQTGPAGEPAPGVQSGESAPGAVPAAAETAPNIGAVSEPVKDERPPTLLAEFDKAKADKDTADKTATADVSRETKPADAAGDKPAAEAAKDVSRETSPAATDKPVEAPAEVKYEFKLPETIAPDHPRMGEFTTLLQEHKLPVEAGQKMIELASGMMADYAQHLLEQQISTFNETRKGWRTDVMADPELGGSGHRTALAAIARMRDLLVSSARPGTKQYDRDVKQFQEWDAITGASDHPALLRILKNAARLFDEPQHENLPQNIKPNPKAMQSRNGLYTDESRAKMNVR